MYLFVYLLDGLHVLFSLCNFDNGVFLARPPYFPAKNQTSIQYPFSSNISQELQLHRTLPISPAPSPPPSSKNTIDR